MPWTPGDTLALAIPDAELEALRDRLTPIPDLRQPAQVGGVDPVAFAELVEYWRDGYDWRAAERALEALEQVQVEVEGIAVHAVRIRGRGEGPRPALMLVHGWPSSFVELLPAAEPLARTFDLVIPSLPGYTFGGPPRELSDATAARIADRFAGLMAALGYERYGASGGDVGARVVAWLGARDPEHVAGIHMSSNCLTPPPPGEPVLSEDERAWAQALAGFGDDGGAYAHAQRTRPGTLGIGLADSPLGLAAWIAEKWWSWSEAGPRRAALRDPLLTTVMLYWWTGCIGSSFMTYAATPLPPGPRPAAGSVTVPAGLYLAPAEIGGVPPRRVAEHWYDVRSYSVLPAGGHFMATEQPELYAEDARAFFAPLL